MSAETSRKAGERLATSLRRKNALRSGGMWRGEMDDAADMITNLLSERDAATARAEAAERERDALRDEWEEIAAGITTEQPEVGALWPMVSEISGSLAAVRNLFKNEIAAHNRTKAERDAARAQIRLLAKLVERAFHNLPHCYNSWRDEARAALTSAKEA